MKSESREKESGPVASSRLLVLARHVLFLLVLITVILYIFKNVEEIRRYSFEIDWWYLVASFWVLVVAYLVLFGLWQKLTSAFGLFTPAPRAAKAWYLSHLGKYVPGKVALLLIRLDAYRGYSRKTVAVTSFVEYFCMLAATCFFVLAMLTAPNEMLPGFVRWIAAASVVFFLGLLWPPLLKRLLDFALRLARQEPIDQFPAYSLLLRYAAAYVVPVLCQSLAFFMVLHAFTPLDLKLYPFVAGSYFAATLVGLAAFFTPSGIGVKEGILFIVLAAILPKPIVIVAPLVFRLIYISVELFLAGTATLLDKLLSSTNPGRR